jgi:NitT/TauT family transport system substrate-binding protein
MHQRYLAVALAGLLLAACGPTASPASAPTGARAAGAAGTGGARAEAAASPGTAAAGGVPERPAPLKARSAYTTISVSTAPWWMAAEGGYFREQGLDVELMHVDAGAALLAAIQNGELDVTGGGGPSIVYGALQGLDLVIIGSVMNTLDSNVMVRPEIRTVDELRGKTIGVSRLKAISDVGARLAFKRAGLEPDVDIFTRGTGGNAETLAAMEQGVVDGAAFGIGMALEAQKRGYREMFNLGQMGIPFLQGAVSTTRRVLRERPELAERYLRAHAQAMSRLRTDRAFGVEVLAKYTQSDDRDLLGVTLGYYQPLYPVDPYPERDALQATLDAEEHPAARTARPEDVADFRFADAVRASGFLETLPR